MKTYKNEFPIFKNNPDLVYLDSAATTQKPQEVLNAVIKYYETYNANIHRGIYPLAEKATAKVEEVREKVRSFLNARYVEEIIFTSGTTEGINLVASTWGREKINQGDSIQVPISEHHANFVPWQQVCLEKNAKMEVIDLDRKYDLSFPDTNKSKLLAISHVSNVLGIVNPLEDIIKTQKLSNPQIRVLVDAAQSVSHMKIDVQRLDCDFLVFSGHKMFAETGVGVLYAKKEILESMPPFLLGGDMIREVSVENTTYADIPHKFEAGTLNISGIISLGAAVDYVEAIGFESIANHEKILTQYCLHELKKIEGVTIIGAEENNNRCGIITFVMDKVHPHDIAQVLGDANICIRAGHHCTMPLHTRMRIPASARVSISLYNTKEDIDLFIKIVRTINNLFK